MATVAHRVPLGVAQAGGLLSRSAFPLMTSWSD